MLNLNSLSVPDHTHALTDKSPSRLVLGGLLFWLAVLISGHLLFINEPFVNQEFAFYEGTRGISEADHPDGLARYWNHQTNPLGYSLITAGLQQSLHLPPSYWSVRIASLAGGACILIAGYFWFRKQNCNAPDLFWLWAGITTTCPLIWIYTGRATADVLPVGMLCLAFTACWSANGRWWVHGLAATLLGLTALVKFNALLFGLGFLVLVWFGAGQRHVSMKSRMGQAALYGVIPAAILAAYFVWLYQSFGVVVMHERYRNVHANSDYLVHFPIILAAYCSFLVMLSGLLALRPVLSIWTCFGQRITVGLATGSIIMAGATLFAFQGFDLGEMKFGSFDHLLPAGVFLVIRIAFLALSVACVIDLLRIAYIEQEEFGKFLVWAIFPTLIIASLTRPAQRYLLFALPWLFFALVVLTPLRLRSATRVLGWASVLIFIGISAIGSVYSVEQGRAADRMAQWIINAGMIDQTTPGALVHHCEHYFPLQPPAKPQFVVSQDPGPDALHTEILSLFGRPLRGYYLRPVVEAQQAQRVAPGSIQR